MRPVIAVAMLLAMVGVACGTKAATTGGANPTAGASSPAAGGGYGGDPYQRGANGGGGTTTPPASAASATVTQGKGGQLAFSPASLTVKQGDTIAIDDVSSLPHTFTIDGQGIDVENAAGQSQTVTISLAPGTYTFICRFHVSAGMQGTLTVTG
jgi:plastocyanin